MNIVYDDVDDMWLDLLGQLLGLGRVTAPSRDGDVCGELIGWSATLDASQQRTLVTVPKRRLSPAYAAAETLWYLSGSGKVDMLKTYAPSYERFGRDDGTTYGAYGPRIMGVWGDDHRTQLEKVISALKKLPNSRQVWLPFWDPHDLGVVESGGCPDIPCTLGWWFTVRDKKLHMSVAMRSNDAWLGFPYDVFAFTCFHRLVAAEVDAQVGLYHHHVIGSMHLYARHRERAMECVAAPRRPMQPGHGWDLCDTLSSMRTAVELEQQIRTTGKLDTMRINVPANMGRDLVVLCSRKLAPTWFGNADVISPRFHSRLEAADVPSSGRD